jgi:murein DD-endopeptidase MepM/ murein hydrolase activator NlpD
MRFYASDKAESKKVVDRLWLSVAEGRVSRRTARKVYVRRKAVSARRFRTGLKDVFGTAVFESLGAALAVGLCLVAALGFCQMKRTNEELMLSNKSLNGQNESIQRSLNDKISLLNSVINKYEQLTKEQREELDVKETEVEESKAYIKELIAKHEDDLTSLTEAEEAKLQELIDTLSELDLFDSVVSRSGNLYQATRDIDAAKTAIIEVLGETAQTSELIDHLDSEKADIKYYRDHYPDYYPVNGDHVSSSYGWRRDPFTGESKFHSGLDIVCDTGSSVWAAASGTVIEAGEKGSYGYCVLIDHGNGYMTRYAHLSKILVKVGEEVQKGEKIAYSGMTGRATGPHLHFEVILNGETKQPLDYIGR